MSVNPNLPSLRDIAPALAELPLEVRLRLQDNHFSGPKNKPAISVRVDDRTLEAISAFLLEIKFRGGLPWLNDQSGVVRAALWLLLDFYGHYYGDQMTPELASVISSERMRGKIESRDRMRQNLDSTVGGLAKQCSLLMNDSHGEDELRRMLDDFVQDLGVLTPYWRAKYVEAALNDRHVAAALNRFGFMAALERWLDMEDVR